MTDEPNVATLATEMAGLPPLSFECLPDSVLQLVGLLQLALRHPSLPPGTAYTARQFIAGARGYFASAPSVLDLIARGDDPAQDRRLGATGQYPYGPADATDEGELCFAMAADHGNGLVRVRFGKPVAWLGLPVSQAREMAEALLAKADEVERRKA